MWVTDLGCRWGCEDCRIACLMDHREHAKVGRWEAGSTNLFGTEVLLISRHALELFALSHLVAEAVVLANEDGVHAGEEAVLVCSPVTCRRKHCCSQK